MIRAQVKEETAERVSDLNNKPLTKGFDKQINALCDEVEELRAKQNGKPQVMSCERMEELANG